jgi:poly-beta-1,6-N-acetyl-D-glucosamine synthase
MININLNTLLFIIFLITFTFVIISSHIDRRKKRSFKKYPFISFIIPTYNDSNTIGNTIESIYNSYNGKFEIIVVNDGSTDNTLEILKKIKKKYPLKLISNKKNLGKVKSMNLAFNYTKGRIVSIIDSDTILNKKAVEEVIARLENDSVAAVSCRYSPIENGFLVRMQNIEFGLWTLVQSSLANLGSAMSMWGGCMFVKREVFIKVGFFSENALTEDVDLALKIGEVGCRVQECSIAVKSSVPKNFFDFWRQRIRWEAGYAQNILKHIGFFIRRPIGIFFFFSYLSLYVTFLVTLFTNAFFINNMYILLEYFNTLCYSFLISPLILKINYGFEILKIISIYFLFPLFSIPYLITSDSSTLKNPLKLLWIIPYSLIYIPIYLLVGTLGYIKGVYLYFSLKENERAW